MSVKETAAEFQKFLAKRGLPSWSERVAHRELKKAIVRLLGRHQSGDVKREGKDKRGFHGVELIAE